MVFICGGGEFRPQERILEWLSVQRQAQKGRQKQKIETNANSTYRNQVKYRDKGKYWDDERQSKGIDRDKGKDRGKDKRGVSETKKQEEKGSKI